MSIQPGFVCAYCGQSKLGVEASDEHVLPKALTGGGLEPVNPFILATVCKRCNNACGRHVDRIYIRSWFTQNQRAQNARRFINLSVNPRVPLEYLGELQEPNILRKTCDFWLGPTGDSVYHFHDPYPDPSVIGGPAAASNLDAGIVFIVIRASNPAWHACIVRSIADNFEGASLYLVNGPAGGPFAAVPEQFKDVQTKLLWLRGRNHKVKAKLRIDAGDRFLGKLALGFGALLLDPAFVLSSEAVMLRNFLWEPDPDKREAMRIPGSSYAIGHKDEMTRILAWPPGHTIMLKPIDGKLVLVPIFYGVQSAVIQISATPAHWQGKIRDAGEIYLVVPGLKKFFGPVSLQELLEARSGQQPNDALENFVNRARNPPTLPPFDNHWVPFVRGFVCVARFLTFGRWP